jgi:hypothetical protein
VRDGQTLQTYEFLHATFGEYLVARLVVQAVRDTEAREAAGTLALRLGPANDDDLLRSLLGFTALTARATVLPFIADLLDGADRERLRTWLAGRTSQAVTRPTYAESSYRPVDKRADHWMSTYSFNLLLLTLSCGGSLRASDLFTTTDDPAYWLRGSALQWRAAIPSDMFMDAMAKLAVVRVWHNGRRDVELCRAPDGPPADLDISWTNEFPPGSSPAPVWRPSFDLRSALRSMNLSNSVSDDSLLHALEPLIARQPESLTTFVRQESGTDESLARSLVALWLASALEESPDELITRYEHVTTAIAAIGPAQARPAVTVLMQALRADADRLPPDRVVAITRILVAHGQVVTPRGAELAVRALLTPAVMALGSSVAPLWMLLSDHMPTLDDNLLVRAFHAVLNATEAGDNKIRDLVRQLDGQGRAGALEELDPVLAVRLSVFR